MFKNSELKILVMTLRFFSGHPVRRIVFLYVCICNHLYIPNDLSIKNELQSEKSTIPILNHTISYLPENKEMYGFTSSLRQTHPLKHYSLK